MSRHEIASSSKGLVAEGDEIQVPLNLKQFRLYRASQAVTETLSLAMVLGCGVGFTGLALHSAVVDAAHHDEWIYTALVSLLLPLMFGLMAWPAVQIGKARTKTLKERLPGLVINREGIWDHSSNYVFGFVPWGEIESVMATSRYSRRLDKDFSGIAFVVKNKNVLLRRKPGLTSAWLNADPEVSDRRQIFIPQGRLEVPVEDLVTQINAFRARVAQ